MCDWTSVSPGGHSVHPGSRPGGGSSCAPLHTGTRAGMDASRPATPSVRGESTGDIYHLGMYVGRGTHIACCLCACWSSIHRGPFPLPHELHETCSRRETTCIEHLPPTLSSGSTRAAERAQSGTCPPSLASLASHDPRKTLQQAPPILLVRAMFLLAPMLPSLANQQATPLPAPISLTRVPDRLDIG